MRSSLRTRPSIIGTVIATQSMTPTEDMTTKLNNDIGAVSLLISWYFIRKEGIGGIGFGHSAISVDQNRGADQAVLDRSRQCWLHNHERQVRCSGQSNTSQREATLLPGTRYASYVVATRRLDRDLGQAQTCTRPTRVCVHHVKTYTQRPV
jgi:hypothetical protein